MQSIVNDRPGVRMAKFDMWYNTTLAEAKVMLDEMAQRLPMNQPPPIRHIYTMYDGTLILSKKQMPDNLRKALGGEIIHYEVYTPCRGSVWRRFPVNTDPVNSSQEQPNREPTHG